VRRPFPIRELKAIIEAGDGAVGLHLEPASQQVPRASQHCLRVAVVSRCASETSGADGNGDRAALWKRSRRSSGLAELLIQIPVPHLSRHETQSSRQPAAGSRVPQPHPRETLKGNSP